MQGKAYDKPKYSGMRCPCSMHRSYENFSSTTVNKI